MAIASSQQIDVEELMGLAREGKATADGRSNDLRYQNQLQWLMNRQEINPKIFLFTFIKDSSEKKEQKIQYLVDVWMNIDSSKSPYFLESNIANQYHLNTLTKGSIEFRDAYKDKWGEWITYYAPIKDESGNIVVEEVITVAKNIQTAINFPMYIYNQELVTKFSASIGIVISGNSLDFPEYRNRKTKKHTYPFKV